MVVHGTFAILGEEGSGKSIVSISKVYEYLLRNLPVISNFDIYLENLMPWWSKATYIRVRDFPSAEDLWALGEATDSPNEDDFGLVLLDEIAVAANAREWNASGRKELIDYFRQTRKHGYDKFFLSQGINSIDSQIRNDLIKFHVICRRTDSIAIPLIGWFLKGCGFGGMLPKYHIATVKSGSEKTAMVADRWITSGKRWYSAYNTKQKFTPNPHIYKVYNQHRFTLTPHGLIQVQSHEYPRMHQECLGSHCILSAWHLRGRYLNFFEKNRGWVQTVLGIILFIFVLVNLPNFIKSYTHIQQYTSPQKSFDNANPSIVGVIDYQSFYLLMLEGNIYVKADTKHKHNDTYYYESSGKYYTFKPTEKPIGGNFLTDFF